MTVRVDANSVGKKKQQRRNVYDRSESGSLCGRNKKKVSFKDRVKRSFRLNRKKECADEVLVAGVIRRRNRNSKTSFLFCSFRRSRSKGNRLSQLPGDADEDECRPYEKASNEADVTNDCSALALPTTEANEAVISDNDVNNSSNKDDTSVVLRNNEAKCQQKPDTDTTNKLTCQVQLRGPTPIYSESIIASYNAKTRYILAKLFNIKSAFSKSKTFTTVAQEDKNTTSSTSSDGSENSCGKDVACTNKLDPAKGCVFSIEEGKDRSSIIISLNDEKNQKRSSIIISLNDRGDRPKPSKIIPINDLDNRSSTSSILFSGLGDDDMDLSYLIEYANQAFDNRMYNLENTRDVVGGSEDNILENGTTLYHNKARDSDDYSRSHEVLCTQQRTSMAESLHLGDCDDDDDVVIAVGPELL